jgi:hypothetical protein
VTSSAQLPTIGAVPPIHSTILNLYAAFMGLPPPDAEIAVEALGDLVDSVAKERAKAP